MRSQRRLEDESSTGAPHGRDLLLDAPAALQAGQVRSDSDTMQVSHRSFSARVVKFPACMCTVETGTG